MGNCDYIIYRIHLFLQVVSKVKFWEFAPESWKQTNFTCINISEKQAFLERERLENAEITRNISYEERHIGKMRQDLQDQEHSRDLLQDEVICMIFYT